MQKSTLPPGEVLRKYRTIAVIGASKNPDKDAYSVPAYLKERGFTVIPVNPTADSILGVKAFPSLAEIPKELADKVEVVEVFRPSDELPEIARQVVEFTKRRGRPVVFWSQLGLENDEARRILAESGIDFVMDRCMRTELKELGT